MNIFEFITYINENEVGTIYRKHLDVYVYMVDKPVKTVITQYSKKELLDMLKYLDVPYTSNINKEEAIKLFKNTYYSFYRSLVIRGIL